MEKVRTSIIVPAYNASRYLPDAITSCLGQRGLGEGETYEVVVVNDGSDDGGRTAEILWRCKKTLGGNLFRHAEQDNGGAPNAMNHAVSIARGDNLFFLDADDMIASPHALAKLNQALKSEPFATGQHAGFKDGARQLSYVSDKRRRCMVTDNPNTTMVLHSMVVGHPKAIRRCHFELIGGCDESLSISYDWDLVLRALFSMGVTQPALVDEVLYLYRERRNSISKERRELQNTEAESLLTKTLHKLGISARAQNAGRHPIGFLWYEHVPLSVTTPTGC